MPGVSQTVLAVQNIREDVSSLQKDMAKVGTLVDRLDTTIDKLTEFSGNVSKLIAIHETKLDFHEKQNANLIDEIKLLRKESNEQHAALGKRISNLEKWMWTITGGSVVVAFITNIILKIFLH